MRAITLMTTVLAAATAQAFDLSSCLVRGLSFAVGNAYSMI
jgi:hypothetical protein